MMGGGGQAVDAAQDSRKYAGAFQISAEGISGVKPEQLEAAIYEVIEDLAEESGARRTNCRRSRTSCACRVFASMDIMSGMGILFFLGQNAALGDWTETNNGPKKSDLVTAADVQRVANTYFANNQRNVLLINTKAETRCRRRGGRRPAVCPGRANDQVDKRPRQT